MTQFPEHHAAEMMVFDVLIWRVEISCADRYSDKSCWPERQQQDQSAISGGSWVQWTISPATIV